MKMIERQRDESCVSDLRFDRWRAGELVPQAIAEIEAHVASCAECHARKVELDDGATQFSSEVWVAGEVARARKAKRRTFVATFTVLVASAATFLVLGPLRPTLPMERSKGGVSIDIFVARENRKAEQIASGAVLEPGDRIRFQLQSPKAGYWAIVGVDGKRAVTVYAPRSGDPMQIDAHRPLLVDGSIELDGTLGEERFFAIVCDEARSLDAIKRDVESTLAGCGSARFVIQKKARE